LNVQRWTLRAATGVLVAGAIIAGGCGGGSGTAVRSSTPAMSIEDYEAALKQNRSDWKLFMGYGDTLQRDHQYKRAIQAYEAVLQIYPEKEEPGHKIRLIHENGPEYFISANQLGKARTALEDAIAAYPGEARFVARLGDVLHLADQPLAAVEQYRKALSLDSALPETQSALDRLTAAKERATTLVATATSAFETRSFEDAMASADQALIILPGYRPAMMVQALANGSIDLTRGEVGKYWDAVEKFSKAETYNRSSALVFWCLGQAYEKLGEEQWNNMTQAYNKAGKVEPDSPFARMAAERLKSLTEERDKLRKFWGK
jgi:tetratricopeptide (TPR) repeat protein